LSYFILTFTIHSHIIHISFTISYSSFISVSHTLGDGVAPEISWSCGKVSESVPRSDFLE
jgi:hypothetical protein